MVMLGLPPSRYPRSLRTHRSRTGRGGTRNFRVILSLAAPPNVGRFRTSTCSRPGRMSWDDRTAYNIEG